MNLDHISNPLSDVLTPEQVADYLQLPLEFILTGLEKREIPGIKIGGSWRVRRQLLDQWLDQQSMPKDEIRIQEAGISEEVDKNDNKVDNDKPDETIHGLAEALPLGTEHHTPNKAIESSTPNNQSEVAQSPIPSVEGEQFDEPCTDDAKLEIDKCIKPDVNAPKRTVIRIRGVVKKFNITNGYGFIKADDGRDVFVQAVDVEDYGQTLKSHHKVEFEVRRVPKGWQAYDVLIIGKATEYALQPGIYPKPDKVASVISPGAQIAFERALAARELGDYKRARELFDEAIRKGPFLNVFQAYSAMEEKENPENAIRVLEKGIKRFPDAGILYNDYAMLKRRQGDLLSASDILKRGLSASPAFARQLHWSLAVVLVEANKEEYLFEAAEHARQAKELGQNLRDDWRYLKLQILTGPNIGKITYRFFEQSGFKVSPVSFNSQWFDLLIQSDLAEYVETYDLKGRIMVRCFYLPVSQQLLSTLQTALRTSPLRSKGLNQDIAFMIAEDISPLRDVLYRLMSDNREAIVPVEALSLTENIHSDDPSGILRPILDQWLSRRDLYRFNYPVFGRRFFGRELDLQRLMRDIDDGHNVGVFGLRKVGKTSLLMQLRELRPVDVIVYFDLQGVPSEVQDCAYIYWAIANSLKQEIEKKKDNSAASEVVFELGSQKSPSFQKKTSRLFDHDIRAVLRWAEQQNAYTRIILIIDEVDRLLPAPSFSAGFQGYPDFFAYLRGASQNSNGRFITIITAANPALCEQAMWEGRDNPIFQFYHQMFLPPLAYNDCYDMIVKLGKGMGIDYDPQSIEAIFAATSGHPYLTRLLCSHVGQMNPERPLHIIPASIEKAKSEFLRGEATPIFNEILERLDTFFPVERDLLMFIADGIDDENELVNLSNQPVDIALYHLVGYQLVERLDGKCRIKIDLLREWLRKYRLGRIS